MAPPPHEEAAIDAVPEAGVEEEDPEEVEPWAAPVSDSDPEPVDSPALWPPAPPPAAADPEPLPAQAAVEEKNGEGEEARQRWPGWPGASVFRLVVPAEAVGSVIGRRGEIIRRLCDETRARVRVLGPSHGAANQIVLVSATEEVEAELPPAMNAAMKVFKHINEIEEINSDGTLPSSAPEVCSVRLLVPAAQAVHLIGKQGVTIKSIQESTGGTIRIIHEDELLDGTLDERIVEIHGASLKVHNALKSVLGLLRKFLVDHGVLHLFERKNQKAQAQDTCREHQVIDEHPRVVNQEFWLSDQPSHGNPTGGRMLYGHHPSFYEPYSSDICHTTDSLMTQMGHANPKGSRFLYGGDPSFRDPHSPDLSQPTDPLITQLGHANPESSKFLYGCNPSFGDPKSPDLRQPTDPLITQITQKMHIPLPYAEAVIGARGENIEFIRSVSGAVVVLKENGNYPGEVLVVIKGSSSQVQTAHQLLQEVLSGIREPPPSRIFYRDAEAGARLLTSPSPPHAGPPRLLNSPHTAPRWLHSPHAVAASRDLPWRHEDEPPRGGHRRHRPTPHHDRRGYWPY